MQWTTREIKFRNHTLINKERPEMKNSKIMMLAVAVMLCLAATTMAQPPIERGGPGGERGRRGPGAERGGQDGGRRGHGGAGRMMMPIMVALDADKDGAISAAEIANASKALAKLDTNGDGQLDEKEMRPEGGMRGGAGRGTGGKKGAGGREGRRGGEKGGQRPARPSIDDEFELD